MNFSDCISEYSNIYSRIHSSIGTDKTSVHSYDKVYDDLFHTYKHSCKKLLEIGFQSGLSLLCYAGYFKHAEIYGIDISDTRHEVIKKQPNINVYIGDATKEDTVKAFPFEFDIIIEDASHLPEHQIQHFKDYSPYIKSGGVYIIEDIHEDNYINVYDNVLSIATQNGLTCELIDLRHIKNRFDDILIVCKRP